MPTITQLIPVAGKWFANATHKIYDRGDLVGTDGPHQYPIIAWALVEGRSIQPVYVAEGVGWLVRDKFTEWGTPDGLSHLLVVEIEQEMG